MKFTIAAIALAATALATPVPDNSSNPPSFKINKAIYGGSGCPQGSINLEFTSSGILPIQFDKNFVASVGNGVDITESRKNCQINLDILYSPGFSFSIYKADYAGVAVLDSGVTGTISANYYFSGSTDQATTYLTINGPYSGGYLKSDDVDVAVWSPCGGEAMFNVNAAVALTPFATSAKGLLAQIVETGKFTNNLYFKWRRC